jgi:hypothetical protein
VVDVVYTKDDMVLKDIDLKDRPDSADDSGGGDVDEADDVDEGDDE